MCEGKGRNKRVCNELTCPGSSDVGVAACLHEEEEH